MKALAQRIRTTRLFGPLTVEQLQGLLERADRRDVCAGEMIIEQGEKGNSHLVLLSGEIEAKRTWTLAKGSDKSYTWILKPNKNKGEFAYLGSMPQISARAVQDCQFLLINADQVDQILGWRQQVMALVESQPQLSKLVEVCQNASVLHQLPLENIKAALQRFKPIQAQAGQTIVTQGDKGEAYYILESGNAEVYQTDAFTDETRLVNKLGPGDFFGEEALVQGGFRSATVKMATPGKLHALAYADFNQLIQPDFVHEIGATQARQLIEQGKAKWLDCRYEIEYQDSRIPNAPLIPLDRMRWDTHKLDANAKYIVYCRSGRRSKAAVFLLRERNIDAVSLAGGIKAWPYEIDMQPLVDQV